MKEIKEIKLLESLTGKTVKLKEENEITKALKKQFYGVSADFEREAKRVINFYERNIEQHPDLRLALKSIKRALNTVETAYTHTEVYLNSERGEALAEKQPELPFEESEGLNESSDVDYENWKKALQLYDTSSLDSEINHHDAGGIKPTDSQDKELSQIFKGSKFTSRFIIRADFGRWKKANRSDYEKDCKEFGKSRIDALVDRVFSVFNYTPKSSLTEEMTTADIAVPSMGAYKINKKRK